MDQDQTSNLTLSDIRVIFPGDDECLAHVMDVRFGSRHFCRRCCVHSSFHKLSGYRAFSCARCGFHVFPCSGTLLHGSSKPLQLWFYAIYAYLQGQTVATTELQKTLGVNYRTARRM